MIGATTHYKMANLGQKFNFTVFTITIEGFDQLIFKSDGYLSKMPPRALGLRFSYYITMIT